MQHQTRLDIRVPAADRLVVAVQNQKQDPHFKISTGTEARQTHAARLFL